MRKGVVGGNLEGIIFDIKEFSIHDGPGARVTVFLKGCPLRCLWCHNPEGLSAAVQLMHKKSICTGCGLCMKGCDHEICKGFERCAYACPNGALSIAGERVSAEELARRLAKNADFFGLTGGGITVSGGEPLMQSEFVIALAEELDRLCQPVSERQDVAELDKPERSHGMAEENGLETAGRGLCIHKALQTSGYADPEVYRRVIDKFDYIMQDIKLVDEEQHIKYTGVSNQKILQNIEYLKNSGKEFVFRVPMIPGITDTEENLAAVAKLTEGYPVEYLKYNDLAGAKYEMLGMKYGL